MISLIATSTFGLEAVVRRQIEQLGYIPTATRTGRVDFQAPLDAICHGNLWLRSAERLFVRLGEFEATDFGQLFDQVADLPWENWIAPQGAFPVRGRSVDSTLSSVPACQKIVKKAIVERLKKHHGGNWLTETGPTYAVEVAILKNQVTLRLDTSGPGLHKRGYRTWTGAAPLKETLAAALVELSFWNPDRPLIDPFCGSGTLVIEAAMLARNLAPGLHRHFASENWPILPKELWTTCRSHALDQMQDPLETRIQAFDTDEKILHYARIHAQQAGVDDDIHFQKRDFEQLTSKRSYGCILTNPPYGIRLEQNTEELDRLYASMPHLFAKLPTWSFFMLTAYPDFEQVLGQQANRRRKLYNGRIECTYYQFHGPKPGEYPLSHSDAAPVDAPTSSPAFGGLPPRTGEQAALFANRLTKRARHLRRWPTRRQITCYRLYDRDIPEIPLVVDRYDTHLHMAEYNRPNNHSPAQHEAWLQHMKKVASRTLDIPLENVFLKHRHRQHHRQGIQYEKLDNRTCLLDVREGGLTFSVNLSDYIDTGLFLDHRITRQLVRQEAKHKKVLNLFAYTGSFSVYAAAGGAKSTTSVDLSHVYLDWAQRNLHANGFTPGKDHRLIRSDAMSFLQKPESRHRYDLAIVDPPTYSNSKTTEDDWDIQKDHLHLLERLARCLTPGGVVYFSTNSRRFKLDQRVANTYDLVEITKKTIPEDFRNQRIHQCWRMVLQG